MSSYLPIADAAVAVMKTSPALAGAIALLYAHARAREWRPFDCSDRWLEAEFAITQRQARRLVDELVAAGCIERVDNGDNLRARFVRVLPPIGVVGEGRDDVPRGRSGDVYVLRAPTGSIKIGFSANLRERIQQLQKETGQPLVILRAFRGVIGDELALHRRYAAHRIRGDWYALPEPLLAELIEGP